MTARLSRGKRTIKALLARDGNLCWLCGEPFSTKSWKKPSIDHVIPRSKGGVNAQSNLKLAHTRCNNARGDAMPHAQVQPCPPT